MCSQLTYKSIYFCVASLSNKLAVICSQRCYWVTDLYIDRWTGWIDCQWLDSGAYVTAELAAVRKSRCVSNKMIATMGKQTPQPARWIVRAASGQHYYMAFLSYIVANHKIDSIQIRKCC